MATERAREHGDPATDVDHSATCEDQTRRQRGYHLGPEDLEEFLALGPVGQRRLIERPGALEAWLAGHAAKYA